MRKSNVMRKGHDFENLINLKYVAWVNKNGGHAHQNHKEIIYKNGKPSVKTGEPFDFEIFYFGHNHVFDAKKCCSDSYSLFDKDLLQIDRLKKCKRSGLVAYFLINFRSGIVEIDIDIIIGILSTGKKTIKFSDGKPWSMWDIIKGVI